MLDLGKLLDVAMDSEPFRELLGALKSPRTAVSVPESAKPYVLAALYSQLRVPVLLLTAHPDRAKYYVEQLSTWCPGRPVRLFPELDTLPYERLASDNGGEVDTIQTLSALVGTGSDTSAASFPPLVVASAPSVIRKVLSPGLFTSSTRAVEVGAQVAPFDLLARWQSLGYRLEPTVDVPGTVSHRGAASGPAPFRPR